jgi:hypothetical protein
MSVLLLCSKLCLGLLCGQMLPSSFLLGMLLCLTLLQQPTPLSFLFLLLSLGHFLLNFDLVFPLGLLLMLHADILKCLEP